MKRIIALLLAAVCLFSFVACSNNEADSTKTQTPEIYDMKILSVNGEDITYEFYRYYYLFVKNSYAESGTEVTEDQIKSDVLDKLLYDAAVHKLLKKYSQSLTDEEIKECEEYVAMYVTAYGDVFESQLESELNMTIKAFTKMTVNEMAYNKLYTYLADKSNNKIDFSDSAVTEYMENFKAGMHLVLSVDNEKEDAATKALIEKLYKIAEVDSAFAPLMKLHELRQSLKETEASLEEINKQIEDGANTDELAATLKTLAAQISAISAKITEAQSKVNVAQCLTSYMEKLEVYKELLKNDINEAANSNDANIISSLENDTVEALLSAIASAAVSASKEKLTSSIMDLANDKSNYGWLSSEFVSKLKNFEKDSKLEDLNAVIDIYSQDKELQSDTSISGLINCFKALAVLMTTDANAYEYLDAIRVINGKYEISLSLLENAAIYASARDAERTATALINTNDDIYSKLEEAFPVLSAPVTTFEELVIKYSEDYEAESGSVVFYLKQSDLIKELQDAVKDLETGEMTEVVKSSIGYHILKLTEPDIEYFKKNEYPYYVLEDMLNSESPNVEYTTEEVYSSINNAKMTEFEKELTAQKNAIAAAGSSTNTNTGDSNNTVFWTIVIMAITIAVVGVLTVLIITASKNEPVKSTPSKSKKYTKKK